MLIWEAFPSKRTRTAFFCFGISSLVPEIFKFLFKIESQIYGLFKRYITIIIIIIITHLYGPNFYKMFRRA